jgi:hypothetical protein
MVMGYSEREGSAFWYCAGVSHRFYGLDEVHRHAILLPITIRHVSGFKGWVIGGAAVHKICFEAVATQIDAA